MTKRLLTPALRAAALALACATLAACSYNYSLLPPNITPNVPLTSSIEQANRKLEEARIERAAVEARFAADEQVCYAKFFVNTCLDEAKEKRRVALAYQRAVELEAEHFVRKSNADQRDRELAAAAKEFEASEARLREAPPAPEKPAAEARAPKTPSPARGPKAPPTPAQLQAEAAKRAANVVKYEKRQAALAERQKRVAEKQAQRAAKEAAKNK